MKLILLMTLACLESTAFAYKDGTYSCKNNYDGLPNTIYKIQTIPVSGIKDAGLPYIEVTRFFREKQGDIQSPIIESHVSGIATRITNNVGADDLQLLAMTLEFENDHLLQCEK